MGCISGITSLIIQSSISACLSDGTGGFSGGDRLA
jgi:hypothetical protein